MLDKKMLEENAMTDRKTGLSGYPSIDKPWLKYYKSDAYSIAAAQPEGCTVRAFLENRLQSQGTTTPALEYFGRKISKGIIKKRRMSVEEVITELEKNHNHSLYEEIYERSQSRLDKTAMLFRGTEISYGEMLDLVSQYAKALKQQGLKKGDEYVVCLRPTPDYPVLVLAASLIGATINLVNADFDPNYLTEIIDRADSSFILVNDWDFAKVAPSIRDSEKIKTTVILPVDRWNENGNPYKDITERFEKLDEESFERAKEGFPGLIDYQEFLDEGLKYTGDLNGHGKLDTELSITYTSGSTKKGFHKGVVQRNETYIIMGRYHDPEVMGLPKMDKIITNCPVGTHADTTLMSGVSDTLMQGGTVALDPIIQEDYFLYNIMLNKVGLGIGTRTYWLRAMKDTYTKGEFKGLTLPYLYCPTEGGEPLSAGEEKALNRWLRDIKAGTAVTHTPFSLVKMSIGGGDTEHGSIFLSLFRDYSNKLQKIRGIKEPIGMSAYPYAEVKCLREDGTYCDSMEMGRLVANSPTSMDHYHNDPQATEKYWLTDAYGKRWGDLGCYGYIDNWDKIYVKGRIKANDPELKPFQIADVISRDAKNIMSCEVIDFTDDEGKTKYVAHIETQYRKKVNIKKALLSAERRCQEEFGDRIEGNLYFRLRSHKEGFPTSFTAKRYNFALREEGISDKCIIPSEHFGAEEPGSGK